MVCLRQQRRRDMRRKLLFGLQGRLGIPGQSESARYAENMRIHCHHLPVKHHRTDHVGCLPSHAGKFLELLHTVRNHSSEIVHEFPSHRRKVLRLVVRVGYALDIRKYLLRRGFGHRLRSRKTFKQGRSSHVHPLVGTLCRQDGSNQKFICGTVMQLGLRDGHIFGKPSDNAPVSLFRSHNDTNDNIPPAVRAYRRLRSYHTIYTSRSVPFPDRTASSISAGSKRLSRAASFSLPPSVSARSAPSVHIYATKLSSEA